MALTIGAEDKKKLYILLGLAGVLGALVMVVINPFGIGKSSATDTNAQIVKGPTMPSTGGASGPSTANTGTASIGTTPPATDAKANTGAVPPPSAQLIGLKNFRSDPFAPYFTPVVAPPPLPPPPPPLPPPLDIPRPGDGMGLSPASLPFVSGGASVSAGLGTLPPLQLPQNRVRTGPRPSSSPAAGISESSDPILASDKRIAGVIIGDSVRALIEISTGDSTITRVVQPGDEVEGMKILRIERLMENDVPVTRMTVLEDGVERYFDLTPSQNTGNPAP